MTSLACAAWNYTAARARAEHKKYSKILTYLDTIFSKLTGGVQ